MRRSHLGVLMAMASTLTVATALSSGCSSSPVDPGSDAGQGGQGGQGGGAPIDAGPDAKPDAKPDAMPDAKPDAEPDAMPDAEPDAEPDAMPDAMPDAGPGPYVWPPHPSDVVFDPDKLHQIQITVDPAKLAQLETDLDNRVPASITYDDVTIDNVGLQKVAEDGFVDQLAGKPAFSIKVTEFDDTKDLYSLARITLESSFKDPSFLREHLGYEMYRRAGIPAKRTAHASVTFNGTPLGIYVVADAIDKRFTARVFGVANFDGNLYEAIGPGDFVDDVPHLDLKGEQSEGRSRIDVLALAKTIKTATDPTFAMKIDQRLDLLRFIDGYALDALLVHKNGYSYPPIGNYWLYDNPADVRFVFLPTGMTDALGDLNWNPYSKPASSISKRIRGIPDLDSQYRGEILHILYDLWDTSFLHARIDKVTAAIGSSQAQDARTLADIAAYQAHVADTHLAVDLRKSKVLAAASATCGNGVIEGFEECDDSNVTAGDGCTAACVKEYCGDGIIQAALGEVCDGFGCKPDCTGLAVCGNLIKDPGEQCDDGNLSSGDGCDATCGLENCTVLMNAGKEYAFCPDLRTAIAARAICQAAGGALAVPANVNENTWMINAAFGVFGEAYWIGISDEAQDGVWRKPDGSQAAFLPWGANEPNGGLVQNCGIISFVLAGGWNDKACTDTNGYICALP